MNDLVPMDFGVEDGLPPERLRARIEELEAAMFVSDDRIEVPVVSRFAQGLYAREVTLPTGTIATGKIHKQEHIVFITKGDVSVLTEKGVIRIKAPATFVSPPGTKRVVYVHEEMTFTTVHATDFKTPEECEENLVVDSYAKYFSYLEEKKCLT